MKLNPYLFFDGRCEDAFTFYAGLFGGTIEAMLPYAGSPAADDVPADWQNKIMHACLVSDAMTLMGSDPPPQCRQSPQGIFVSLQIEEPGEAERLFAALAEGGAVRMPLGETFWALRFGMLVDRFGIPWMVNCSRPA
jgi:PhnB protein